MSRIPAQECPDWTSALRFLRRERMAGDLPIEGWHQEVRIWRDSDKLLFSLPVALDRWAIASSPVAEVERECDLPLSPRFRDTPTFAEVEHEGTA